MEKKYVLQDILSGQYFDGSRFEPFFSKDSFREFDSEQEAVSRLDQEMKDFGKDYFAGRAFAVVPVYKYSE